MSKKNITRWPWDRPTVEQTSSFISPMYIKIWEAHFTAFAVSQKKNNSVWVSIQVRFEKSVGQEEKKTERTLQNLSVKLWRNVWRSCIYQEQNEISLMLLTHPGQLSGNSLEHSVPVSSGSSGSKNRGQSVALGSTQVRKWTLPNCSSRAKKEDCISKFCNKTVVWSCSHNIAEYSFAHALVSSLAVGCC